MMEAPCSPALRGSRSHRFSAAEPRAGRPGLCWTRQTSLALRLHYRRSTRKRNYNLSIIFYFQRERTTDKDTFEQNIIHTYSCHFFIFHEIKL